MQVQKQKQMEVQNVALSTHQLIQVWKQKLHVLMMNMMKKKSMLILLILMYKQMLQCTHMFLLIQHQIFHVLIHLLR